MDKQLIARREQAEASFNNLTQQKEQKEQEIREIDTELARLQGEYRLVNDLLNNKAKVSPKADTINVDAALKEKK